MAYNLWKLIKSYNNIKIEASGTLGIKKISSDYENYFFFSEGPSGLNFFYGAVFTQVIYVPVPL